MICIVKVCEFTPRLHSKGWHGRTRKNRRYGVIAKGFDSDRFIETIGIREYQIESLALSHSDSLCDRIYRFPLHVESIFTVIVLGCDVCTYVIVVNYSIFVAVDCVCVRWTVCQEILEPY